MTSGQRSRTILGIIENKGPNTGSDPSSHQEAIRRAFDVVRCAGNLVTNERSEAGDEIREWHLDTRMGHLLVARVVAERDGPLMTLSHVRRIGRSNARAVDVVVIQQQPGGKSSSGIDWVSGIVPGDHTEKHLARSGLRQARVIDPTADALGELCVRLGDALSDSGIYPDVL